jgi:hypothetical protein
VEFIESVERVDAFLPKIYEMVPSSLKRADTISLVPPCI